MKDSNHHSQKVQRCRDIVASSGIHAIRRLDEPEQWRRTIDTIDYVPVDYSSTMIDYQNEYWSGKGFATVDQSLLLFYDNQACGIWPLSVTREDDNKWRLGSNGGPILQPLFGASVPRSVRKQMTAMCYDLVHTIRAELSQEHLEFVEPFLSVGGLSKWHEHLMTECAIVRVKHELFVDLNLSLVEIKSAFRKSYRALVTSGSRLWRVDTMTYITQDLWEIYMQLHRRVAGGSTRSTESWHLQRAAVNDGDAFFVCLWNGEGEMVGGGLFHVTSDEGLYAVGAYDRSLFDKPLGHVVQYHAIIEMKRRGIRWYKIGIRAYPNDLPRPSEKEIAIATFKEGFATHLFPRFEIRQEHLSVKETR